MKTEIKVYILIIKICLLRLEWTESTETVRTIKFAS